MTVYTDRTGRHVLQYNHDTAAGSFIDAVNDVTPFGTRSVARWGDTKNAYLTASDNLEDFVFGTGDFCIEFLAKFSDFCVVLDWFTTTGGTWQVWWEAAAPDGKISLYSGFGYLISTIVSISDTYKSYCFDRSAGTLRIFLDGLKVAEVANSTNINSTAPTLFGIGAQVSSRNPVYDMKSGSMAYARVTKASRHTAAYTPSYPVTGASDPLWASTVLFFEVIDGSTPTQTVAFTSRSDTVGWVTISGSSDKTVSGTVSAELVGGQFLRVSFDNGTSWANATVDGTSWTVTDATPHSSSFIMKAQVVGGTGTTGPLTSQAVTLLVMPSITFGSMTLDSDTIGDWITYNGAAGRTVSGTLSSAAPAGATVQLSSDGVSWTTGSLTGLSWAATDPLAHTAAWTYQARLVSAEGLVSSAVSQEVFLTTPPADFSPQGTFTKCLDLVRRFCQRTGLPQPTYVIGNQDIQIAQLMGLLEESLEMLVRRPERGWQVLTREALFVTKNQEVQGSLSNIAPGMIWITDQTIFNRTTRLPMYGPLSPEERQLSKALQTAGPYYRYWITEDQLHLYPVPPAGQLLAFEYVSAYAWVSGDTTKPRVYRDSPEEETDICVLPRDVVLADLRWRWKKEKGLEYAQDFESFELLFARATSNDGMRRDLSMEGTPSIVRPGILVPAGSWPITGK